jgi:hypothetical protein
MARHIYLKKRSNDLVSHCDCVDALITFPPQADCPWCGCGWLFTCIECRKAFTFATAIEIDEPWEDLALRDLRSKFESEPSADDVREWVAFMKEYLAEAEVGKEYVAFDGRLIPSDKAALDFDGWHATHKLGFVPQVAALEDRSIIDNILSNVEYWQSHALGDWSPSSLGQPAVRDREKKWWQFWR